MRPCFSLVHVPDSVLLAWVPACRAELQVPAWVTRSRHTATQLATWVNASQADPVLRWGVRLTPLLTLSLTDIRTGLRLTTRGCVHATLLSTGLHVTDQQARLKQLLYDKVWPANAGKPSPGPAANAALGRTGFLAPEDDSCQLLGPLPFRAALMRRFVRDRRRIALGLGCHLPRSEEERRSQAQLQWRRLVELQQLQRASDFAMFLLSATHRSAAKILAAEPDVELQPFDYYRMLMQQYRREQDAVQDGPDRSALLSEQEAQDEEVRGRGGSSGGGAVPSEAPPSPRTQAHVHEAPSPLPSQSPSRRGQRHNRSSSLLSSSPNLLRSLSLGLRSTSAHAFAAMSKHVASGSRDATTAPGAVPAPSAPRPALDAHVLLPRRRTTEYGRTSSTSSFVFNPSAAPQGGLHTHPSGSTRFGPNASSQVLPRKSTTATMAQVLTSANNAHLANLIALRRSAATGNLPAGGSSIMGLGLASGIAGRASMRRIPEDARLGSFGSSGTRGLSSGMPSGGLAPGGLVDSLASERTLQSSPSTGSGGGGADRDAGGLGHGGLPAYGSPWTTASSWKAGQAHPLGRSGSLGRSTYAGYATDAPHQTQGGRGAMAWSASYARTPFGVAAAAAAAAAAQAAAAGESDERRRIDGVQRDAERKLSFVQAYRHMGKVQFPLGPTQQRVTYVHGMPLTAPCIAALVSKLPGSASSAPGIYLRTSCTHLLSCVGVHSLGAILHMVVQVSQVCRVGEWVMAAILLGLHKAIAWCILEYAVAAI